MSSFSALTGCGMSALLLVAACHHVGPLLPGEAEDDDGAGGFDDDSASDVDADADADTDSDIDGDSDVDETDTGSDTETASEDETDTEPEVDTGPAVCPANSGWPCSCDEPGTACGDGSLCATVFGMGDGTVGYCAKPCPAIEVACPATYWNSDGLCLLTGDTPGEHYCALVCDDDADCPPELGCSPTYLIDDYRICHP